MDNTNGSDDINMYAIDIVDTTSRQVELLGVENVITEWQDRVDINGRTDLYNRGVRLNNVSSGARGQAVLATKKRFGTPDRVYLYPADGFHKVEAPPAQVG